MSCSDGGASSKRASQQHSECIMNRQGGEVIHVRDSQQRKQGKCKEEAGRNADAESTET